MKYLRNFNESVISLRDELHDFCVDNLVWLIDEGFEIKTFAGGSYDFVFGILRRGYTITINKPYEEPSFLPLREFKWTDIQDVFIQFIDRLSNFNTNLKIDIIELTTYRRVREYKITAQDLLQNNVERIEDLRNIVEVKIEISNSGKNTINKI
jgi:hypothetical protein